MKVLILNGSPRVGGNTTVAVEEMERIFREEGVEVETVQVGARDIRGCIACGRCAETGRCVFDDIVNELAPKLEAADGLVVELPNRGVFVREFTPQDIQEIFDVRVLLESYCIQRSVQFMTTEHKQELMRCLDQITYYHERQDMKKHIEADCQLHGLIIRIGGNRLVEDMYQRISAQVQQFRIYSLESKRRFRESLVEHTTVVHCLLTGNVEEADRVNRRHLELARDKINEYLISKQTNQPLE